MQITSMKDLDKLSIEQIIRLHFFYSLRRARPDPTKLEFVPMWEITFKCNKVSASGGWQLLDFESEDEFIVRYKLIDPTPAPRELITRALQMAGVEFTERNKIIELTRGNITGSVLRRILEMGVVAVHIQEMSILLTIND